jgi:hypothetical protein
MIRLIQAVTAAMAALIVRGALTGDLGLAQRLAVLDLAACIVALIVWVELQERRPPPRRTPR